LLAISKSCILLMAFITIILSHSICFSQDIIKFSGSLDLTHDFYSSSGIAPRQPDDYTKAILRSTITLFDEIQLPFELYLASDQSEFKQPFNQFGISPRITKWLKLHGGYFSSDISELTFGDVRLLGGGIELTPGDFRFSFLYGRSQKAIETDITNNNSGAYKRNIMTVKIGYGNMNSFYTNINFVRAIDDSNSIIKDNTGTGITPVENTVASLEFGFPVSNIIKLSSEIGVSAYSNNIFSDKLSDEINIPSFLFTPRVSSQFDGAAKISMEIKPANDWQVNLKSQWIGPGYVTLGYAQLQNDIFETTISPSAKLFKRKLTLKGSFGFRKNNLRNNRKSTTNKYVVSVFTAVELTQELGLDIQYNNNQVRSNHISDSIKVSNIFNFISLSPRYNFQALGGNNNIVLNYSFQEVEDDNQSVGQNSRNKTNTVNLSHVLFFQSSLSFTSTFFYTNVKSLETITEIIDLSESVSHSFFENKLNTSVSLGYSITNSISKEKQFTGKLAATYSMEEWGAFTLNITNQNCSSSGDSIPSYREFQANIQYKIKF
jgi:hypothetical protein